MYRSRFLIQWPHWNAWRTKFSLGARPGAEMKPCSVSGGSKFISKRFDPICIIEEFSLSKSKKDLPFLISTPCKSVDHMSNSPSTPPAESKLWQQWREEQRIWLSLQTTQRQISIPRWNKSSIRSEEIQGWTLFWRICKSSSCYWSMWRLLRIYNTSQ